MILWIRSTSLAHLTWTVNPTYLLSSSASFFQFDPLFHVWCSRFVRIHSLRCENGRFEPVLRTIAAEYRYTCSFERSVMAAKNGEATSFSSSPLPLERVAYARDSKPRPFCPQAGCRMITKPVWSIFMSVRIDRQSAQTTPAHQLTSRKKCNVFNAVSAAKQLHHTRTDILVTFCHLLFVSASNSVVINDYDMKLGSQITDDWS